VRSTLALEVGESDSLARIGAEVAVAGFFRDQRPLRGGAGLADWRLCGFVSQLLLASRAAGEPSDAILTSTHGRLRAGRLLLVGLGARQRFGAEAHRAAVERVVHRLLDLGAPSAALDLPGPAPEASPETVARNILEGACAALDARPARFLLRVVAAPGAAGRLRHGFEQVMTVHPRGATSLRLVRPAASGAAPGAAAPRASLP